MAKSSLSPAKKPSAAIAAKSTVTYRRKQSDRIRAKTSFSKFVNTAADPLVLDYEGNIIKAIDVVDDSNKPVKKRFRLEHETGDVERYAIVKRNEPSPKKLLGRKKTVGKKPKKEDKANPSPKKQEDPEKGKRKTVRIEDVEDDTRDPSDLPSIRLRTTPKQLANVMCSLTPAQQACVSGFGFGSLIGFNIDLLPGRLVYYVVDNFDPDNMVIKTVNGDIKADHQAVHDVFGILLGGVDMYSLEHRSNIPFVHLWLSQFPQKKLIRASAIGEKILSSTSTDRIFQMNFLMLFANTMASSERNGKINETVLSRVSDDVDIASVDWCGYVLNCLKHSKTHWNREDPQCFYNGPATFLTLLYLDRTKFDAIPVVRQRPIFKNWKGAISVREKKEAALGSFGMLELWEDYVGEEEQGEGFMKLEEDKKHDLSGKEGYYKLIEEKFDLVSNMKKLLLRTFQEGLSKYPDDEILRSYYKRMDDVFSVNKGVDGDLFGDADD